MPSLPTHLEVFTLPYRGRYERQVALGDDDHLQRGQEGEFRRQSGEVVGVRAADTIAAEVKVHQRLQLLDVGRDAPEVVTRHVQDADVLAIFFWKRHVIKIGACDVFFNTLVI